jgi:hypothetical protein
MGHAGNKDINRAGCIAQCTLSILRITYGFLNWDFTAPMAKDGPALDILKLKQLVHPNMFKFWQSLGELNYTFQQMTCVMFSTAVLHPSHLHHLLIMVHPQIISLAVEGIPTDDCVPFALFLPVHGKHDYSSAAECWHLTHLWCLLGTVILVDDDGHFFRQLGCCFMGASF